MPKLTFSMLADSEKIEYVSYVNAIRSARLTAEGRDPQSPSRPPGPANRLKRQWQSIYHNRRADVLDRRLRLFLSALCTKYGCCDVDRNAFIR